MLERMKQLIKILNEANKAYYQGNEEIMSNKEYDALYDELLNLENETGIVLSNTPTHTVGYEVLSELSKEKHPSPMLSLDKTKDPEELKGWLGNKDGVMSWKMDGLTVVLTYDDGELIKAVTRGNGEIGELITSNAKQFANIPLTIPYKEQVIVRGEAIITYDDFREINEESEVPYKNPRNLCSGTIRQLDGSIVKERHVRFIAFELVTPVQKYITDSYDWLTEQGFECVGFELVTSETFDTVFQEFKDAVGSINCPTDGLVLRYNDYEYGESLGSTDKFPKHSLAFKWQDETAETVLTDIEWETTRSGTINPTAVFQPVDLEGTIVQRAYLHNVNTIRQLQLGIGDEITVYKANMIIPQVDENLTKSNSYEIPEVCPECGAEAILKQENDTEILYCTNPTCKAKLLSKFTHFVSRECMNINGLSEETLKKMIDNDWITGYSSLYTLDKTTVNKMMRLPGLGRKSVENIMYSIEASRTVQLNNFINALGIAGVGKKQAKEIAKYFNYNEHSFLDALEDSFDFRIIPGFGDVMYENIYEWYDYLDLDDFNAFFSAMNFVTPFDDTSRQAYSSIDGKTFVITGSLNEFKNRTELQNKIEAMGGKVTGTITSKTDYLINNDIDSMSAKNKKAKELNIPIITEKEFMFMMEGGVIYEKVLN